MLSQARSDEDLSNRMSLIKVIVCEMRA